MSAQGQGVGAPVKRQRVANVGGIGVAPSIAHAGRRRRARRHRCAVPQAKGRVRPPWRLPDSRRWASDAAPRRAAPLARPRRPKRPAQGRRGDREERGKPRGRQVDEIVEPRRRPAEVGVAGRAVADHAVGGIDGLVECGARQTRQ